MKKILIITYFMLALSFLLTPIFVSAQAPSIREEAFGQLYSAAGDQGAGFGEYKDPRQNVALIIRSALGLIGLIFMILSLYAGFLWMTAGGEEENITKAKGILRASIIGLIIILTAYSLTNFVISRLLRSTTGANNDPLKNDFCLKNPNDDFCIISD